MAVLNVQIDYLLSLPETFAKPSSHPERSEGSPINGYRWTWEILRQAQNDKIEGFAKVSGNRNLNINVE